jgi:hypothetical protein
MAFGLEAPAILAIVGATAAIAGTGIATVSAVKQSKTQAAIAEATAESYDIDAENKKTAAEYEENQFRRRAALLMGKQSAIFAASGIDPSSGSPLLQMLDTVKEAEMEAQNIRRTGQIGESAARFGSQVQRSLAGGYGNQTSLFALGGGFQAMGQGTSALSSWMRPTRYSRTPKADNYDYGYL